MHTTSTELGRASGAARGAARVAAIYFTDDDHRRLAVLAGQAPGVSPGAAMLRDKLDRAEIRSGDKLPPRLARLGSTVRYRLGLSGAERTIQLVLPEAADIDANRVSVFTPVGAALLGLRPGESFAWTGSDDAKRSVTLLEVGGA